VEQLVLPVDLGPAPEERAAVRLARELEQEAVAAMAQAIVAVHLAAGGRDDESAA
jgi:hypothetical protein